MTDKELLDQLARLAAQKTSSGDPADMAHQLITSMKANMMRQIKGMVSDLEKQWDKTAKLQAQYDRMGVGATESVALAKADLMPKFAALDKYFSDFMLLLEKNLGR